MKINKFWTDEYISEVKAFMSGDGIAPKCMASWDYVKLVSHAKNKSHNSHDVIAEVMTITNGTARPDLIHKEYKLLIEKLANQAVKARSTVMGAFRHVMAATNNKLDPNRIYGKVLKQYRKTGRDITIREERG